MFSIQSLTFRDCIIFLGTLRAYDKTECRCRSNTRSALSPKAVVMCLRRPLCNLSADSDRIYEARVVSSLMMSGLLEQLLNETSIGSDSSSAMQSILCRMHISRKKRVENSPFFFPNNHVDEKNRVEMNH